MRQERHLAHAHARAEQLWGEVGECGCACKEDGWRGGVIEGEGDSAHVVVLCMAMDPTAAHAAACLPPPHPYTPLCYRSSVPSTPKPSPATSCMATCTPRPASGRRDWCRVRPRARVRGQGGLRRLLLLLLPLLLLPLLLPLPLLPGLLLLPLLHGLLLLLSHTPALHARPPCAHTRARSDLPRHGHQQEQQAPVDCAGRRH